MRTRSVLRVAILAPALAALVVATLGPTPSTAGAQQRPSASTVAAWVQTFYDQTQTMGARFTQRYRNRVYQRTDVSRGRVRFKKPGMMRFDYDDPNGKVVASDGQQLIVYEPPQQGQRAGQYYQQAISQSQLPSALSFLTGTGRLARDFTFRALDPTSVQWGGQLLELRPRRPTPHYTRILLFVDDGRSHANLRGVVHRIVIIDQAGNTNRFDFEQQQFNETMADSVFRYRPPASARRIQP